MSGEGVMFCYLGAVGAIWVLNVVKWSFSRTWIDGLFTLLVLISFTQSIYFSLFGESVPLSKAGYLALHSLYRGLIKIIFLELIYFLLNGDHWQPFQRKWWRWAQLGVFTCMLINIGLLLLSDQNWYRSTAGHLTSGLYWSVLMGVSLVGIRIARKRLDAIGITFIMGSIFMFLNELYVLFYALLHRWPFPEDVISVDLQRQILWGERIMELLWFSLCLVFYQRQLAVVQAVEQTRLAELIKQERLENELALQRVEQEKTEVQLRALQAQVNPHFLFNSLNSLSSLIDDEPERANQFVNELSLVYRYLLKANDQPLTSLSSELGFIQSYYHLLKIRHGNGLNLFIRVDSAYEQQLLPPLTLQLLVENAVKHNVTSTKRPLTIDIHTDSDGALTVQNNLQLKTTPILSNGVGLGTIIALYQRLQQPLPVITTTDDRFVIRLPLINPAMDLAVSS